MLLLYLFKVLPVRDSILDEMVLFLGYALKYPEKSWDKRLAKCMFDISLIKN